MSKPLRISGPFRRPVATVRANAVRRTAYAPCAPDPLIYVETFQPAITKLFWTIVEPKSWKQEIELLTGRSWLKNLAVYMDAAEEVTPAAFDGVTKTLFSAAAISDAAGWFWFVGTSISAGISDWTSLARKWRACDSAPMGNWFTGANCVTESSTNEGWEMNCGFHTTSGLGTDITPGFILQPPHTTAMVIMSAGIEGPRGPGTITTGIGTPDDPTAYGQGASGWGDGQQAVVISGDIVTESNTGVIGFWQRTDSGTGVSITNLTGGYIAAMIAPNPN